MTFRHASNYCKRVLETGNLAYGNKTKESFTSKEFSTRDVLVNVNSVFIKSKPAVPSF